MASPPHPHPAAWQVMREKSDIPSNFTMKLRKHLRTRRCEEVRHGTLHLPGGQHLAATCSLATAFMLVAVLEFACVPSRTLMPVCLAAPSCMPFNKIPVVYAGLFFYSIQAGSSRQQQAEQFL